jgi:hypothetical protein
MIGQLKLSCSVSGLPGEVARMPLCVWVPSLPFGRVASLKILILGKLLNHL